MYDATKEQKETTTTGWDATNAQSDRNYVAPGTDNEEMQGTLTQVKEQAKQAIADTVDDVKAQANSRLAEQKQQAADRLGSIASALRTTSQDLHEQDETVAQYVDSFADQIEKVSGYIQNRDISELLRDAQQLARRRPELFVASALATGFLVGRFFKSSTVPAGSRYEQYNYKAAPYHQARYGQYGSSSQYGSGSQYGRQYDSGSQAGGSGKVSTGSTTPSSADQPWGSQSSAPSETGRDDTYSTAAATSTMESEGNYAR